MGQPSVQVDADIVVVGAGAAGMAAALEASQHGATVALIDMNSQLGGHALTATGLMSFADTPAQRERGIEDSPERFLQDIVDYGVDPNLTWARFYVEQSRKHVQEWLEAFGAKFDGLKTGPGNSADRLHAPVGRGFGTFFPLIAAITRDPDIKRLVGHKAVDILVEDGRARGVMVEQLRTGVRREIRGHTLIVATGGFQSNLEMVREHYTRSLLGPVRIDDSTKMLEGSGWFSRGSGLHMVREIQGKIHQLDRQWNYGHGAVDPRFEGDRRGLNVLIRGVWVDTTGKRFMNEDSSMRDIFAHVLATPGQTFWDVFDADHIGRVFVSGTYWNPITVQRDFLGNPEVVKSANSLEAIADQIGVPAQALRNTIARYNAMVAAGEDTQFGRFTGGKRDPQRILARPNEPPLPIVGPRYFAVQFHPLPRKSMGGISVDARARVLLEGGGAIPGLVAAGEVTGFGGINGRYALEGLFLSPSILMGRVAAATAWAELSGTPDAPLSLKSPVAFQVRDVSVPRRSRGSFGDEMCTTCHPIEQQIHQRTGDGWLHYRLAHREAQRRSYDCAECHGAMTPPRKPGDRHRMADEAWLSLCATCHSAAAAAMGAPSAPGAQRDGLPPSSR